jgi:hypothetical protein
MGIRRRTGGRALLLSLLVLVGTVTLCIYGVLAAMSVDLLWFRGGALVPDPARIVIRVDGEETVLTAGSAGYDTVVRATREALSEFDNLAPLTAGLSEKALVEYQHYGTILELYFDEAVNFRLPFDDGKPTALLIPIEGPLGGRGYVFRGREGRWWSGQMVMSDPQPLVDALSVLGLTK